MSVIGTLLVFGGIPAAVVLLVAALVYAAGGQGTPRYRPGRPYNFAPVWYLAAAPPGTAPESGRLALPAGGQLALPSSASASTGAPNAERGGARGTW